MPVCRVMKVKNYTTIFNAYLQDNTLSMKAKGLLTIMLSLPENWDYTVKGLAALSNDGRDSIAAAIKELEEHRYVRRCQSRGQNGSFSKSEYWIYETPQPEEGDGEQEEEQNLSEGGGQMAETGEKMRFSGHSDCKSKSKAKKLKSKCCGANQMESTAAETKNDAVKSFGGSKDEERNHADTVRETGLAKECRYPEKTMNTVSEELMPDHPSADYPITDYPITVHPITEDPLAEDPLTENAAQLNTYQQITNQQNNRYDTMCARVRAQIEYPILCAEYPQDQIDELVSLIAEVMLCRTEDLLIAGAKYPREIVRSRMCGLRAESIRYVFDSIRQEKPNIRNIKKYLLAALFNASATQENYVDARVQHDVFRKGAYAETGGNHHEAE